jgi:outer membrane protein TolC
MKLFILINSLALASAIPAPTALRAQQPAPPSPNILRDTLTLQDVVAIAQQRGLSSQAARSARDAARARDHAFGARLMPQLAVGGQAANYSKSITPAYDAISGKTVLSTQNQNASQLGVSIAQELPWTGSRLSVGSSVTRIDNFSATPGSSAPPQTWTTQPLTIGLEQDLFKPRTVRWDQRQQTLTEMLAERTYLESREDVAASVTQAFFDYYAAQVALDNAATNAAVNDTLYTLNKGRYEVGKIGENDLLQSELALLRARASLDGAKVERDRAEAAVKRHMQVSTTDTLRIHPPETVPVFEVDPALAVQQALRNSSTMEQNELDGLMASRRVNDARYSNRFNATVGASYGYNRSATVFNDAYQALLPRQSLRMDVTMPLFQWGGGRAEVDAARMDEKRIAANARARRDQLEEDGRFAALQLTQSQRMVLLSAKADTVANKRFEVAKNRYVIGKIGISDLYIAQNEKDQALTAYVQALRQYWTNYYRLRRVTLFDFEKGKPIE